jgi:uncharacterized protein with FMN-binding domain
MRRAFAALAATLIAVVWLVTFKVTPLQVESLAAEPTATAARTRTPTPTATSAGRTAAPTPTVVPGTPAASGTFTGALVDTRYGAVQVRIIVSGQKVVDVQAVALPRDRARSAAISQYSSPILRSEAIQAQSARIDVVSGATYTSVAYSRSLDAALKQAHLG